MSARYLRSVQGILKLFQIIFCVVIVILFALEDRYARRWPQTFLFSLSIACLILTAFLLLVSLCDLYQTIIWPWKSIEIGFHITAAILFGIASSLVIVVTHNPISWVISGVFGFLNTGLYGIHTYFSAD